MGKPWLNYHLEMQLLQDALKLVRRDRTNFAGTNNGLGNGFTIIWFPDSADCDYRLCLFQWAFRTVIIISVSSTVFWTVNIIFISSTGTSGRKVLAENYSIPPVKNWWKLTQFPQCQKTKKWQISLELSVSRGHSFLHPNNSCFTSLGVHIKITNLHFILKYLNLGLHIKILNVHSSPNNSRSHSLDQDSQKCFVILLIVVGLRRRSK